MKKPPNFREEKTVERSGTRRVRGSILFRVFASAAGLSWSASLSLFVPGP